MFKYISIPVLLISFSLGILYVYLTKPEQTYIYVYPTPDNVNLIQYKDKADNCYEFESHPVVCPIKGEIQNIPVQK